MLQHLAKIDRRWLFLAMFLAVAVPLMLRYSVPEQPTEGVRTAFRVIDEMRPGSRVFFALDYDPASRPELGPMTTAMVRHCALRGQKIVFLTLWPLGTQMIEEAIEVLKEDFPGYQYGEDYINLGYQSGLEGVIQQALTNLNDAFPSEKLTGRPLSAFPIMRNVNSLRDSDLLVSVGAGDPGTKQWVQYAATPYPNDIQMVAGTTGVSAPGLYPYVQAGQLKGLIPALKGAAEYETLLAGKYEQFADLGRHPALVRMGAQFVAHLLMVLLIIAGNVLFLQQRRQGRLS